MECHKEYMEAEISPVTKRPGSTFNLSDLYEQAYCRACHFSEVAVASGTDATQKSASSIKEGVGVNLRHPGRTLHEDFLCPRNLTPERLSVATGICPECLADLLGERLPICTTIATALTDFFGGRPAFWLELQAHYDNFVDDKVNEPEPCL